MWKENLTLVIAHDSLRLDEIGDLTRFIDSARVKASACSFETSTWYKCHVNRPLHEPLSMVTCAVALDYWDKPSVRHTMHEEILQDFVVPDKLSLAHHVACVRLFCLLPTMLLLMTNRQVSVVWKVEARAISAAIEKLQERLILNAQPWICFHVDISVERNELDRLHLKDADVVVKNCSWILSTRVDCDKEVVANQVDYSKNAIAVKGAQTTFLVFLCDFYAISKTAVSWLSNSHLHLE